MSDTLTKPPTLPTCGVLYREASDTLPVTDLRAFAVGFMAGQMEKVGSGACAAAMFRPPDRDYAWQHGEAVRLAAVYGLRVSSLHTSRGWEIWAMSDGRRIDLPADEDSPTWHLMRAHLCGIKDADPEFHKRQRKTI